MVSSTHNASISQMVLSHYAPYILLAFVLYYLYISHYAAGLNRYPGPLLAKFGKFWHRMDLKSNRHQLNLVDLHRKYGDVVRIGPTTVSISDPNYIPKVYGVSTNYRKSDMYDIFAPRVNGKRLLSLLSARDPEAHAELHKPMAREFAVSVISEYEPLVDKTLQKWVDCLDERFCQRTGEICDIAVWVRMLATEAIMDVTFSESMGFLDAGGDVDGFMDSLDKNTDTSGLLVTMPWTSYIARHNPIIGLFRKSNTIFPVWAASRINKRLADRAAIDNKPNAHRDFLDRFLDASPSPNPPYYNFSLVINWCLVNIMAGGDTTAIALASIVYHILKTPYVYKKLVHELRNTTIETSIISWKHAQTLPYLDACIREGIRMHPSVGLGLERETPGLVMPDNYSLPAGTKVSMNAWVIARQASVFGPQNVDTFVPERWLRNDTEDEETFRERLAAMKRADLVFGHGARACTGKFVAKMEMYKAVATLFREFDVRLMDPEEEWIGVNRWMTRVRNVRCVLERVGRVSN